MGTAIRYFIYTLAAFTLLTMIMLWINSSTLIITHRFYDSAWSLHGDDHLNRNTTQMPLLQNQTERKAVLKPRPSCESYSVPQIGVGGGIISSNINMNQSLQGICKDMIFFHHYIPSFCKTASTGFRYHFYLAYNYNDQFFGNASSALAFQSYFKNEISEKCSLLEVSHTVHLIDCPFTNSPALCQNLAMWQGYLDGMDYLHRTNDDTRIVTKDWTRTLVTALNSFTPRNVGVVGPLVNRGPPKTFTYDLVHRTHVDVFGLYYPHEFPAWYADGWITRVYQPDHSLLVKQVVFVHLSLGKSGHRYTSNRRADRTMLDMIKIKKPTFERYLKYLKVSPHQPSPDGSRVISMSLYGSNLTMINGALRNAQLAPIHFPGWRLRIYVADPYELGDPGLVVAENVLCTLGRLGVDVIFLNMTAQHAYPPSLWRLLTADDPSVDYFIIRNADERLTDRDYSAVNQWLTSYSAQLPFHFIHDTPDTNTSNTQMIPSHWGASTKGIRQMLPEAMLSVIQKWALEKRGINSQWNTTSFVRETFWGDMQHKVLWHDGISCVYASNILPFPTDRTPSGYGQMEYVGMKYDPYHRPVNAPPGEYWQKLCS